MLRGGLRPVLRRVKSCRFPCLESGIGFILSASGTLPGDRSVGGRGPLKRLFLLRMLLRGKEGLQLSGVEDTAALAAVSRDPGITGGEGDHTAAAVILAAIADQAVDLGKGKCMQCLESDKGGRLRIGPADFLHGSVCGADGPHESRIRSADDFPSYILFNGAEDSVVAEGTALDNDPVSQRIQTADADDLCKNILDDRAAEACKDIVDLPAVFLLGDNAAVHKDRAAASQNGRVFCLKGALRDLRRGDTHIFRKVFQERTAAGGTGLIDHDIRDDTVVEPDRLHILAADIKDKGCILQVFGASPRMSHRLDDMGVRAEGFGCQKLSVACGRHTSDMECDALPGELFLHLKQALSQDRNGIAAVVGIEGIEDPLLFIQENKFSRSRTAVDAQIAVRTGTRVKLTENMLVFVQRVASEKCLILLLRRKKGTCFGTLLVYIPASDQSPDPVDASVNIKISARCCRSAGIERSTQRHHELRLFRDQNVLVFEFQFFTESLDQSRMEAQRTALKNDGRRHGESLGKAADGLLGNGMQSRQGDVFLAHALIQQRLDIGLGIDAAAPGYVIELCAALRQSLVFLGLYLQKGSDFIDEGSRSSRTASVHAHIRDFQPSGLFAPAEKNDLRVLAAQLNGCPGGRIIFHDSKRVGHDLLHKGHAGRIRKGFGSRTCKGNLQNAARRDVFLSVLQQRADTPRQLGVVPCILTIDNLLIRPPQNNNLCRC